MNREQIERAEKIARRLARVEAVAEASEWKKPRSLSGVKKYSIATKPQEYTFSDEQFRIALASLDRQGNG